MAEASPDSVLSHWSKLLEGLQASPLEFYAAIEIAVASRQIPEVTTSRVDWHEGGMFSANREYLRVERGRYMFDVCGAPFGTGFFASTWLAEKRSPYGLLALLVLILGSFAVIAIAMKKLGFFMGLTVGLVGLPVLFAIIVYMLKNSQEGWDDALVAMPILGPIYERIFRPQTYYKTDTYLMFQSAVHSAVMEVVDQFSTAKGLRTLSESERKPIMKEFYQR